MSRDYMKNYFMYSYRFFCLYKPLKVTDHVSGYRQND